MNNVREQFSMTSLFSTTEVIQDIHDLPVHLYSSYMMSKDATNKMLSQKKNLTVIMEHHQHWKDGYG